MIHSKAEFLMSLEAQDEAHAKKMIYKGTTCGAALDFTASGIRVGSIVEGVDQCTQTHELNYPFMRDRFWAAVESVNEEALEIWGDTHGCDDCPEDPETGYNRIDPDCKTCGGEGVIL